MHSQNPTITVQVTVNAPVEKVWECFTTPQHIMQWNNASPDWHTPHATNDLQPDGKFRWRMEAKDGSFGFDFNGVYDVVNSPDYIEYSIEDGRKVKVTFEAVGNTTQVTETFEPENENSLELQQQGWQAILDNFKKYVEEC